MIKILFLITVLLFPAGAFGADAFKFRHAASLYADAAGGGIKRPEGVACNDKSAFIVADTANGRLLLSGFQGGTIKPGTEIKLSELPYPILVKLSSKGDIFVLDGKKRRILRLSAEGTFKSYLDPASAPPPATIVPRSFALDRNDNVYVLDIFSERVLVLDTDGKFQKQVGFPKESGSFSDITVDAKGTMFLVDSTQATIWSASKDAPGFTALTKGLKEYMDFPVSIATDNRGTLYVTDQHGGGVVVLGQDGSFHGRQFHMGWSEGLVNFPSQLCINEKGELYLADRNNNRVQVFTVVQ
jgi:hypothetical protein